MHIYKGIGKCGHETEYKSFKWQLDDGKDLLSVTLCDKCKRIEAERAEREEAEKLLAVKKWVSDHGITESVSIDASSTYGDFAEVRVFVKVK